jgi:hypothetical protein
MTLVTFLACLECAPSKVVAVSMEAAIFSQMILLFLVRDLKIGSFPNSV